METLGAALGLPAIRQKVMLLFHVFHSWCHSMVPFMDLGDKKKLLMFILVLSSALSTPWTQSWHILPIFFLSLWPASSHFHLSSIQTPSYLDYSSSPYPLLLYRNSVRIQICYLPARVLNQHKGLLWMEQTVALWTGADIISRVVTFSCPSPTFFFTYFFPFTLISSFKLSTHACHLL